MLEQDMFYVANLPRDPTCLLVSHWLLLLQVQKEETKVGAPERFRAKTASSAVSGCRTANGYDGYEAMRL